MDLWESIAEVKRCLESWLEQAKEKCHVLDGEVIRRDHGLSVTMGHKLLLFVHDDELPAPAELKAFRRTLRAKWDRELERWQQRSQKRASPRKGGGRSQRGGERPRGRR